MKKLAFTLIVLGALTSQMMAMIALMRQLRELQLVVRTVVVRLMEQKDPEPEPWTEI